MTKKLQKSTPMKKSRFWLIFGLFVKVYPYEKTSILADFWTFAESAECDI